MQAEGALQEAGAKMGPKFGVDLTAIWPRDRFVPIEGLPLGFGNVYIAAAGFVQTIYAGEVTLLFKEAAKLARDAAEAEKERITQTVTNSCQGCLLQLETSMRERKSIKEALVRNDHLARAEKLFKSGLIAKETFLGTKLQLLTLN